MDEPTLPAVAAAVASEDTPARVDTTDHAAEKLRLECEKLRLEAERLRRESAPRFQRLERVRAYATILGSLGSLSAVVAIGGLAWSIYQSGWQARLNDEVRNAERLERALSSLSAPSPHTRVNSVGLLDAFVRNGSESQQSVSLQALANALPFEKDPVVRNAITTLISSLPPTYPETPLRHALQSFIENSRALARDSGLKVAVLDRPRLEDVPPDSQVAIAMSVGAGLSSLVRHRRMGRTDLAGIACLRCDFRGAHFGAAPDFTGAILTDADFSDVSLSRARFDDALLDSVSFRRSDLQGASFTFQSGGTVVDHPLLSVFKYRRRAIRAPDFSCADLRAANFAGNLGFPIYSSTLQLEPDLLYSPTFALADLEGARLDSLAFYYITRPPVFNPPPPFTSLHSPGPTLQIAKEVLVWSGFSERDRALDLTFDDFAKEIEERYRRFKRETPFFVIMPILNDEADGLRLRDQFVTGLTSPIGTQAVDPFSESLERIAAAFDSSNWSKAALPPFVVQLLQAKHARETSRGRARPTATCEARHPF
jgi:uncharacterized protein YjbI with pentapeptide repeats